MNLYCIGHKTRNYRDRDNYSAEDSDPPCLFKAKDGEDRDAFISRLIREEIKPEQLSRGGDFNESYTSFSIDFLFSSEDEDIERDVDIESHPAYIARQKEEERRVAKIRQDRVEKSKAEGRAERLRRYKELKKEFEGGTK